MVRDIYSGAAGRNRLYAYRVPRLLFADHCEVINQLKFFSTLINSIQ